MQERKEIRKKIISYVAIALIAAAVWGTVYAALNLFAREAQLIDAYETVEKHLKKGKVFSAQYGKVKEVTLDGDYEDIEKVHSREFRVPCEVTVATGECYQVTVTYNFEEKEAVFLYPNVVPISDGEKG